ncbi:hypothetical protein L3X38_044289 [Prunus dulcis]|uniref:FAD-binding domain-containing protein n=1 Tax=Prunus dulcis TaxID=3755 RepID=A0AAD4YNS6_PRUDU|nr:hypothetical protein L3X38_044289 [Prunus dulcis]
MRKACDVVDAVDVSYATLDVWASRVRCRMRSDCIVRRRILGRTGAIRVARICVSLPPRSAARSSRDTRYESVFAASKCTIQNMFMSHLFCFVYSSCLVEKELEENPAQLKQHILSKFGKTPDKVRTVIENTELDAFISSPLRYRHPWELLWGNISKVNVCVAGDALHPMTPGIGQGGCSALEDGVVLARCLGEALLKSSRQGMEDKNEGGMQEHKKIEVGLKKYANERKWRSFALISTGYVVVFLQGSEGKIMTFLNKFLAPSLVLLLLKKADFDCGKLSIS